MDHRATEPVKAIIGHPAAEDALPAFEVIDSDHHFKIWASGRTEGFAPGVIINRIPRLMLAYAQRYHYAKTDK
jgi:hypothetical protein